MSGSSLVLGIDPGMAYLGLSLAEHGHVQMRTTFRRPNGTRARDVRAVGNYYAEQIASRIAGYRHHTIAIERMVFYRTRPESVDDLLDIQAVGAFVAGRLSDDVHWYEPAQWKGQLGKDAAQAAQLKILSDNEATLRQSDLAKMPTGIHEHALDAEGILLHHLGRFGPPRRTRSFK